MNVKPKRALLMSGSLYLTPPQKQERCFRLLRSIEHALERTVSNDRTGGNLLRQAPAQDIVKILEEGRLFSWWMFDSSLTDWTDDVRVFSNVEAVLLSDCKEESGLYDFSLLPMSKEELLNAFQTLPKPGYAALLNAYGLDKPPDDYETCLTLARNFINDARYALWTREIWSRINSARGKAYLCHYDEVNPFGSWPTRGYPIAHHCVDLFASFGGYDEVVNEATKKAGRLLRGQWINFINGEEPWPSDTIYCFGPDGQNGQVPAAEELDVDETRTRRRQAAFKVLKQIGIKALTRVWQQLLPTTGVSTEEV